MSLTPMTRVANRMFRRIEAAMTGDEKNNPFSFESVLYSVSIGYGLAVKLRRTLYEKRVLASKKLPCKVISIGNITVGGTGKTPMTIYVAQLLKDLGYNTVIISRGYKGDAEKHGGMVSDGRTIQMEPEAAGDEAFMMAVKLKDTPVLVGKNRFNIGMSAVKGFHPDVIVLDDAFQHIRLKRDIDLALLDARRPFGNGRLIPRGTLREPATVLNRADALIFTRSDSDVADMTGALETLAPGRPIFRSFHQPHITTVITDRPDASPKDFDPCLSRDFERLNGRRVYAFSGIADNDDFRRTIERFSCEVVDFKGFADHHPYSLRDLETIGSDAERACADMIMTTEKDYVRIPRMVSWPVSLAVIGVTIAFEDDGKSFHTFLKDRLAQSIGNEFIN